MNYMGDRSTQNLHKRFLYPDGRKKNPLGKVGNG